MEILAKTCPLENGEEKILQSNTIMQNQSHPSISNNNSSKATALKFIVLLGVVSLFADVTYEGARSINGPYLALLGASATTVGIVAGLGELIGYSLRLVSGYISDRIGQFGIGFHYLEKLLS